MINPPKVKWDRGDFGMSLERMIPPFPENKPHDPGPKHDYIFDLIFCQKIFGTKWQGARP
jgi:hypothetical protein